MKKQGYLWLIAFLVGFSSGCRNQQHISAELQSVVGHYRQLGDRDKREAAEFLISHMDGLQTVSYDLIDSTGKVSAFSLYAHPGATSSNYQHILDSLGLRLRSRMNSDLESLTADYLIRNIDLAFDAWHNNPWSKGYSEELFHEYILPHRIDSEEFSDWREFFIARYRPMIDTMSGAKDIRSIARLITCDVRSWFDFSY